MLICAQDAAYKHYSIHYLLYVDFSFAATLLSWTEDKLLKVIMTMVNCNNENQKLLFWFL